MNNRKDVFDLRCQREAFTSLSCRKENLVIDNAIFVAYEYFPFIQRQAAAERIHYYWLLWSKGIRICTLSLDF